LLLSDADAKRRSRAQGGQAAGASRSWCATYGKEGRQRQLQLFVLRPVLANGVGSRWLLPTESVSGYGVWDRLHLGSFALELRRTRRSSKLVLSLPVSALKAQHNIAREDYDQGGVGPNSSARLAANIPRTKVTNSKAHT